MGRYILKRLLQIIPILLGTSFIIFMVFTLAPGDAVDYMAAEQNLSEEKIVQLKKAYGLDKPKIVQYFYWLKNAAKGEMGYSYKYKKPVKDVMSDYIWNSFILALSSYIVSILIAIPLGIVSATKQYSMTDSILTVIALIGISLPTFFFGVLLIKIFAVDLKCFPVAGMVSTGSNATGIKRVLDIMWHMFLPFIVLSYSSIASLMRYVRTSMLEVIRQDYIRTARAKGLKEKVVIYKHALRNSLIPVITIIGMWLPGLFSGAIITEQIFSWPGIGNISLNGVMSRDYPLLMGMNMLLALLTLVGNLLADITYAFVDPRIRYK